MTAPWVSQWKPIAQVEAEGQLRRGTHFRQELHGAQRLQSDHEMHARQGQCLPAGEVGDAGVQHQAAGQLTRKQGQELTLRRAALDGVQVRHVDATNPAQ